METLTDFIFLGSKITAEGDHSHEIKWHLLLRRKAIKKKKKKKLDSVLKKQRHFADKCQFSQSYGFTSSHVQMWELGLKKAAHQGIDAFEL